MFNVSNWLAQEAKLKEWNEVIDGNEFELISLTDDLIETARASDSLVDLIDFCASNGLLINGVRALDYKGMTPEKLSRLWLLPNIDTGDEPSIKHQIGLMIAEESGLSELFADFDVEDIDAVIVDGDNLTDDQLNQTVEQFQSQAS